MYAWSGALTDVMGRGGTDLRPVFAGPLLAAHGVEGVIYFTDGDGPTPDTPPSVPVLWILTKPEAFTCPWGERAWLGRAPLQRTPQKRATRGGGARGRSAPG